MLRGAWVQGEQRGRKGKTWGLGTRKNALARGVGGKWEGCHPVLCGLRRRPRRENCPLHISAPSTLKWGKNSTGFTGLL